MSSILLKLRNLNPGERFKFVEGQKEYILKRFHFEGRAGFIVIYRPANDSNVEYQSAKVDAAVYLLERRPRKTEMFSIKRELARPVTADEQAEIDRVRKLCTVNGKIDKELLYLYYLNH